MTISQATETFFGKPIRHWSPGDPAPADAGVAWRLAFDHDDDTSMVERLEQFLQAADPAGVTALVFGDWEDSYDAPPEAVLDLLCRRAADLPALRALFVGDMTYEECEISWIKQADYTWVLEAFPALQVLRIGGSDGLVLPADAAHAQLRELVIECGGLPKSVLERLAGARLPALERLELWVGTDEYGFDGESTGRSMPQGSFAAEAEGVALWSCPGGNGYWVAVDQLAPHTTFHFFDRETLEPRGSFHGNTTSFTDGIALDATATRRFPGGALYAVDDDKAVTAFDLREVAATLGLDPSCVE